MRLSRTLLTLAACTGLGLSAAADLSAVEQNAPRVAEVVVQGADQLHADRVFARLGTRKGDILDRAVMAEDVRAIYDMRAFTGIRTEVEPLPNGQVRVIYVVSELPYVGEITIRESAILNAAACAPLRTRRGSYTRSSHFRTGSKATGKRLARGKLSPRHSESGNQRR